MFTWFIFWTTEVDGEVKAHASGPWSDQDLHLEVNNMRRDSQVTNVIILDLLGDSEVWREKQGTKIMDTKLA